MRVITLQEPWASLIGEKIKVIETRSWPCYQYGEIYIHAGLQPISKSDTRKKELANWLSGPLHYGTIFAKCTLSDCVLISDEYAQKIRESDPKCFLCGDFTPGRYAWVLTNILPIEPIPKSGKLGIWYYGEDDN
jgi:hypothetical protein